MSSPNQVRSEVGVFLYVCIYREQEGGAKALGWDAVITIATLHTPTDTQ